MITQLNSENKKLRPSSFLAAMDALHASVAPVAAERHPLQPGSPQADSAGEVASPHAAADADFFTGAAPPLVAPPGEQARADG